MNSTIDTHGSFPFFRFFGEDVSFERLLVRDFPCAGHFEALFGTGIRFYLRHFENAFKYESLEAFPISRDPCRASSEI